MNQEVPFKKFVISWVAITLMMFGLSVVFHGLFADQQSLVINGLSLSGRVLAIISLCSTATISLIFHALFYFGGLTSAPIVKGLGLGMALGFLYFMLVGFGLGAYSVHASFVELGRGILWQICEQGIGGVFASVISLTEIHRWGVFRMI